MNPNQWKKQFAERLAMAADAFGVPRTELAKKISAELTAGVTVEEAIERVRQNYSRAFMLEACREVEVSDN